MSTYTAKRMKGQSGKVGHAIITCGGKLGGAGAIANASVEWEVAQVFGSPQEKGIDLARRIVEALNKEVADHE